METTQALVSENPVEIVASLKRQLYRSLECDDMLSRYDHQNRLEKRLEQMRDLMCGSFFVESARDIFDRFQLERELVDQGVLGDFLVNLDRMPERVSCLLIAIFKHVITNYVYQTRRPLVEKLENNDFLLAKLCRFGHDRQAVTASLDILVACCAHLSLASKLLDLRQNTSPHTPLYIELLGSVNRGVDFHQICEIFNFVRALLLTYDELSIRAITRDLRLLIDTFNPLLAAKSHWLARFKCLGLLGDLVQSRHLHAFMLTYTSSIENLKLFFEWARETLPSTERKQEFIKIFEVFRLFFLNPTNMSNKDLKDFVAENYMMVNKIVDQAEQARSYTDQALIFNEYNDVRERINKLADKQPVDPPRGRKSLSMSSLNSL